MGHVVFIGTVVAICIAWWVAVYRSPWTLSVIIKRGGLIFTLGFGIFAFGLGSAAVAVYAFGDPRAFVGALLTAFWGGWLMLAPSASARSTPEDIEMMERLALMLVALMCVLVLSFYASPEVDAGLQLWLVLLGAVLATREIHPSRRSR